MSREGAPVKEGTSMSPDDPGPAGSPPAVRPPRARPARQPVAVVTPEDRRVCPATQLLHRIGDRWSVVLLTLLARRPHGYNELDRAVSDLSRRVLTRTLRTLEDEGYVSRTARTEPPYRVEYDLTPLGRSLHTALQELGDWAREHR